MRFFLQLIKRLPNLDEKNKEKPLCYPYSVKARALLHAHFQRLDLPPDTLAVGMYTPDTGFWYAHTHNHPPRYWLLVCTYPPPPTVTPANFNETGSTVDFTHSNGGKLCMIMCSIVQHL